MSSRPVTDERHTPGELREDSFRPTLLLFDTCIVKLLALTPSSAGLGVASLSCPSVLLSSNLISTIYSSLGLYQSLFFMANSNALLIINRSSRARVLFYLPSTNVTQRFHLCHWLATWLWLMNLVPLHLISSSMKWVDYPGLPSGFLPVLMSFWTLIVTFLLINTYIFMWMLLLTHQIYSSQTCFIKC